MMAEATKSREKRSPQETSVEPSRSRRCAGKCAPQRCITAVCKCTGASSCRRRLAARELPAVKATAVFQNC